MVLYGPQHIGPDGRSSKYDGKAGSTDVFVGNSCIQCTTAVSNCSTPITAVIASNNYYMNRSNTTLVCPGSDGAEKGSRNLPLPDVKTTLEMARKTLNAKL